MDNLSSYILIAMFAAIAIWLFLGYFRTRGIIYKDRMWNAHRILFLAAGVLCLVSVFVFSSVLDWVRLGLMFVCVIGFLLVRDGVGEEGIAITGRMYKWSDIKAYDYGDFRKNQYRIYIQTNQGDNLNVTMPNEQKKEVLDFVKAKIGKKYTRMKKG